MIVSMIKYVQSEIARVKESYLFGLKSCQVATEPFLITIKKGENKIEKAGFGP